MQCKSKVSIVSRAAIALRARGGPPTSRRVLSTSDLCTGKSMRGKKVVRDVDRPIKIDDIASRPQTRAGTQKASQTQAARHAQTLVI